MGDTDLATASTRPIRLVVRDDRLEQSRVTTLFRLLLALPHLAWLSLWTVAAITLAFVAWLAVLFERRVPATLHGFLASYVRYGAHVTAYLALAAAPYPGFTGDPGYPIDVEIDPPTRQGRWGAGLRLLLAIPALLLSATLGGSTAGVWGGTPLLLVGGGGLAWVAAFLGWFACVARGRMPRGLRDAVAYSVGYSAQATGYVLLLTDRYPCADPALVEPAPKLPLHPVRIEVRDGLRRSRLIVAFRLLLVVPHLLWLVLWSGLVVPTVVGAWLAALATGRVPGPLHRFVAAFVRYSVHVNAFLFVVGGPFPGFVGSRGRYPVDVELDGPARQRRLPVLVRPILALPALLLTGAYGGALIVVGLLGWCAALVTGRMPGGIRELGAAALRYSAQTNAYLFLLTDRYPDSTPTLRARSGEHLGEDVG